MRQMQINGEIWYGEHYRLACPECGAFTSWTLITQRKPNTSGEQAWAVCAQGHPFAHPLVYPEMIHAMIDWSWTPEAERSGLTQMLDSIAWQPHRFEWAAPAAPDTFPTATYWPWSHPRASDPQYWQQTWPDPDLALAAHRATRRRWPWQR